MDPFNRRLIQQAIILLCIGVLAAVVWAVPAQSSELESRVGLTVVPAAQE